MTAVVCQRRGREKDLLDSYSNDNVDLLGAYSSDSGVVSDDPVAALYSNIPGEPGQDYPIYNEVPDTAFSCDGQVDGGRYFVRTIGF